jgi:hypothetical protein
MRILLAIAILLGSMLAPGAPADAARKYKRGAKPPCYAVQPRHLRAANSACARGAWGYSPYDPVGEFRGFPGWARKVFSEGRR